MFFTVSIAELLKQYPNHHFIDTITMIVASGVRVGFEGSNLGQTPHPNLALAFAHPDIITNSIQSEISKGNVKEVDSLPQIISAHLSVWYQSCQIANKLGGEQSLISL